MSREKAESILSGTRSKAMWKAINKTKVATPDVWEALYSLACRCQELEAVVAAWRKERTR